MKKNKIIVATGLLVSILLLGYIFADNKTGLSDELKSQIESIELYKVPAELERTSNYKSYEEKYAEIIELINKYYEGKGIEVSGDLDDLEYQQLVKSLGTAIDILGEDYSDQLLEFVKFIDLYENIAINNEMNELLDKYNNGTMTSYEAEYLINLAPIKSDEESTLDVE